MKHVTKSLALLLALLTLVLAFASCTKDQPADVTLDLDALGTALSKVRYEDILVALTDETVLNTAYPVTAGAVKKIVYGGSGATPEEIILCEYENADEAAKAKTRFENHLNGKKETFDTYNAQFRPLLDDAILEVVGKYVIYSVSADAAAAKTAIEAAKTAAPAN